MRPSVRLCALKFVDYSGFRDWQNEFGHTALYLVTAHHITLEIENIDINHIQNWIRGSRGGSHPPEAATPWPFAATVLALSLTAQSWNFSRLRFCSRLFGNQDRHPESRILETDLEKNLDRTWGLVPSKWEKKTEKKNQDFFQDQCSRFLNLDLDFQIILKKSWSWKISRLGG